MKKTCIVIFGITSNLAQIKLIPSLYDLFKKGLINSNFKIFGLYRQCRTISELNEMVTNSVGDKDIDDFWKMFEFVQGDFGDSKYYVEIKKRLVDEGVADFVYYLATFPEYYQGILDKLKESDLTSNQNGFLRLVVEKPLGNDWDSSVKLNGLLNEYFKEEQIYRIDHYLGKETIQNILAFRLGNDFVNTIMDAEHVDHIQLTISEAAGVEDRLGFYDKTGALKDVGQNHLLQMMAVILMKVPKKIDNNSITKARIDVFDNLRTYCDSLVLGQYEGYPLTNSSTNTYFAFKSEIKSGPLAGIPIYARGGKRMKKNVTEINIVFKNTSTVENVLTYRIKPEEGIIFKIAVKKPGFKMNLLPARMEFCFKSVSDKLASAYEKLFVDILEGDPTFFNDGIEVEKQWQIIDALKSEKVKVHKYEIDSWGPKEADEMIKSDGRRWIEPEDGYCSISR